MIRIRARRGVVTRSFAMSAAIVAGASGALLVAWFVLDPGSAATSASAPPVRTAAPPTPEEAPPAPVVPDRKVTIYFGDPDAALLQPGTAVIKAPSGTAAQAKLALQALLEVPKEGGIPVLPDGTRVVSLFLDEHGEAVVDLSAEASSPRGVEDELLSVGAIALTLRENFPEIARVRILLEGREASSLAGHLAIDYPIRTDDPLLLALVGGAPEAPPDGPAPGAP